MSSRTVLSLVAVAFAAATLTLGGCDNDREVRKTTRTSVRPNGSVSQHETTVRQSSDGTVIKEETRKTNVP